MLFPPRIISRTVKLNESWGPVSPSGTMVLPQTQCTPRKETSPHGKIVSNLLPEMQQQNGLLPLRKRCSWATEVSVQKMSASMGWKPSLRIARASTKKRISKLSNLWESDVCASWSWTLHPLFLHGQEMQALRFCTKTYSYFSSVHVQALWKDRF